MSKRAEQPADVARAARHVLARSPSGLLTDVDGTISHITPTPEGAVVCPSCRAALEVLARRLRVVAVISGRAAADVRRMVALDGLVYVGNHGLEWWLDGRPSPVPGAEGAEGAVRRALDDLRGLVTWPGVQLEDKGLTLSFHYRLAEDPETTRSRILRAAREAAERHGLRVTEGRRVVEVRPPVDVDKGAAASALVERFGLRGAVYLGDDLTDVDAFRTLRSLRARGLCDTLAVGVAAPDCSPIVLEAADALVDGVDGACALLQALAVDPVASGS